MIRKLIPATGLLILLFAVSAPRASGATPDEVNKAIKGGTAALKTLCARGNGGTHGIGGTCLAGLALLEAGVPVNDPVVKAITDKVRDESYKQTGTYQISLCLMYLDRFGDPADVPVIQMLAVRLLIGQTSTGGWTYSSIRTISEEDERRLRAMKPDQGAGKLHPDVERYGQALAAARAATGAGSGDDNSNTQFGVLAVWMARKHGVPVEDAMKRIEERFMATQEQRTGNWPYNGLAVGGGAVPGAPPPAGSPSMYCPGLLGMATALARREDRRPKHDPGAGKTDPTKPKPGDPFSTGPKPDAKLPARPAGPQDRVVQLALAGLGQTIAEHFRAGKGLLSAEQTLGHGHFDLYFLWSLERVGVIYGLDKIGNIDWYDAGSTALVRAQANDGSWGSGGYGAEVNTAFAVLFLCKSNLARDLSSKVQKDPTNTEMRAGAGVSVTDVRPSGPAGPAVAPLPVAELPNPTGDEAITLASKLLKAPDANWAKLLTDARDAKGPTYTRALVVTATHTDGDRKKAAREALAERLCRMSGATLRTMLKGNEVELRRAAALACAMKDDKDHIPDLIGALADADDTVVRAAKAGLKSLTGQDFGPTAGAPAEQKEKALAAWRDWYAKQKK